MAILLWLVYMVNPLISNWKNCGLKNLAITTGLVNANTTEMLMKAISSSSVDYTKMLTHRFKFSELEKAYDVFKHAAENQAMKVVLEAD